MNSQIQDNADLQIYASTLFQNSLRKWTVEAYGDLVIHTLTSTVQAYEDPHILKWFSSKQFHCKAVLWVMATLKDTKYMKNIFQDKFIILDLS